MVIYWCSIAVASNYSFIAETATMTIHPIRLTGLVVEVPDLWNMDKCKIELLNSLRSIYISEESFRELMFSTGKLARDIGTVLVGFDAVKSGLIDEVGGVGAAVKKLENMINNG